MKRLVSLIIVVLLFFGTSVNVFAEDLWSERKQWEDYDALYGTYHSSHIYTDYLWGVLDATVLLYTDLASSVSVVWTDELEGAYLFFDTDFEDVWKCPEFDEVLEEYLLKTPNAALKMPLLKILVQEFNVTKDELYTARDKMLDDPDWILAKFPELADTFDEFKRRLSDAKEWRTGWILEDFMIEALYLEDEQESRDLLLAPGTIYTEQGFRMLYFMDAYPLESQAEERADYIDGWYLSTTVPSMDRFRDLVDYARKSPYAGDPLVMEVIDLWEAKLLKTPATGDGTAVYALIFTLAALPLAGFGVYEWKRRRRAV